MTVKEYLESKEASLLVEKKNRTIYRVKCSKVTLTTDPSKPDKYQVKFEKNTFGSCCGKGKKIYSSNIWFDDKGCVLFMDKHICK